MPPGGARPIAIPRDAILDSLNSDDDGPCSASAARSMPKRGATDRTSAAGATD